MYAPEARRWHAIEVEIARDGDRLALISDAR